ncbi:MAG: transposase, partial [Verrucomicrobia bacterium]
MIAQPRATKRYRGVRREKDAPLVAALRRVSAERPRAGSRVAAAHLRREGWTLNDKRAQRLWREEGLKVPRRQRKLRRLGSSANSAQRLRATRINAVWSY